MGVLGTLLNFGGVGRASGAISNANVAAEHGVLNATTQGQTDIMKQLQDAIARMTAAGGNAISDVNTATAGANKTLGDAGTAATTGLQGSLAGSTGRYGDIMTQLAPYLQAGQQGVAGLEQHANAPGFSFNYDDYKNDPAYAFQMQQGQNAIQNSASASGLGQSGAALKELTQFGQGLASTYYDNAFQRAQSTFNTNQNATMQNLGALVNSGEFGAGQANTATSNINQLANTNQTTQAGIQTGVAGQQAQNTIGAGTYSGNTQQSIAQLLSQLGISSSEFGANLGLQGATTAGQFAVGAGTARAGGILGQTSALNNGISGGIGGLISLLGGGP